MFFITAQYNDPIAFYLHFVVPLGAANQEGIDHEVVKYPLTEREAWEVD